MFETGDAVTCHAMYEKAAARDTTLRLKMYISLKPVFTFSRIKGTVVRGRNSTPALVADLLHLQNCYKNISPPFHTLLQLSMVKDLNPPLFFLAVFYFALQSLIEIFAHNSVNVASVHRAKN